MDVGFACPGCAAGERRAGEGESRDCLTPLPPALEACGALKKVWVLLALGLICGGALSPGLALSGQGEASACRAPWPLRLAAEEPPQPCSWPPLGSFCCSGGSPAALCCSDGSVGDRSVVLQLLLGPADIDL